MMKSLGLNLCTLCVFFSIAMGTPPASQAAIEPAPTQENIKLQMAEIQGKLGDLPANSPDRPKLALELMRLKKLLEPDHADPRAPKQDANAGLPPEAYSQWRDQHIKPLQDQMADYRKTMAMRTSVSSRQPYLDAIATTQKKIDEKEKEYAKWVRKTKLEYPNGAIRCTKCRGAGKIQQGSSYVPPVVMSSGRTVGGGQISDWVTCRDCGGAGWISKSAVGPATAGQSGELLHSTAATTAPSTDTDGSTPAPISADEIAARRNQLLAPVGAEITKVQKLVDQLPASTKTGGSAVEQHLRQLKADRDRILAIPDAEIAAPIAAERQKAADQIAAQDRQKTAVAEQREARKQEWLREMANRRKVKWPDWEGPWKFCPLCNGSGRDRDAERRINTQNAGIIAGQMAGTNGIAKTPGAYVPCDFCGGSGQIPDVRRP